MSTISNSDFAARVMELARAGKDFKPTATYDPDGDCVEFLARPDPFYAERIDDLVTVYYSQIDNEIVGSSQSLKSRRWGLQNLGYDVHAFFRMPHASRGDCLHPRVGDQHFAALSIARVYSLDAQSVTPAFAFLCHCYLLPTQGWEELTMAKKRKGPRDGLRI